MKDPPDPGKDDRIIDRREFRAPPPPPPPPRREDHGRYPIDRRRDDSRDDYYSSRRDRDRDFYSSRDRRDHGRGYSRYDDRDYRRSERDFGAYDRHSESYDLRDSRSFRERTPIVIINNTSTSTSSDNLTAPTPPSTTVQIIDNRTSSSKPVIIERRGHFFHDEREGLRFPRDEYDTSSDHTPNPPHRSYSPRVIPDDLIAPVPAKKQELNMKISRAPPYSTFLLITTKGFLLGIFLDHFLSESGTIERISRLSYTALFVQFKTHTITCHAWGRMIRNKKFNVRVRHYECQIAPEQYVNSLIATRIKDAETFFDPPKILVLHNFDKDSEAANFFQPFTDLGLTKWTKEGANYITYHTTLASFKDFYSAFNEGNAGLPNTYVTEIFNTVKLKQEVFNIIRKKLIVECMQDCNQMLIDDVYIHTLNRVRFYNEKIAPNLSNIVKRPSKTGKLLNFVMSRTPINFRLSPATTILDILSKVKKVTKERKAITMKKNPVKFQEKIKEKMTEKLKTIESIKQPDLSGPCSRLSAIRPIKESRKREYLRAYARARLQPLVVARDSGLKIRQTQFPAPKLMMQRRGAANNQMRRGINGKRVYFEKSTIQGYGLFALEPISSDSLICEYNGELIRSRIADLREKQYEQLGFPHMFLFRIDNDTVVDATMRGGKSRFLNHSCHPNCRSKIINVGKTQTISFYAIRNIKPHDEITFNYQMEFEDRSKRERCYCGAKQCLGYLNYCADPEIRRQREHQAYLEWLEAQEDMKNPDL
ncbi:SET domain containing protein [Trichomonas vaginalis G3]|uniref:[histone H3]-lysine(4) N-trimethyltransferase n=1 Tax=Trichomonas vaginalis (strain ATCC PRA-98 / G3) TaxID=412133 RepID=A2DFW8_TRIV3|nr:histone-lysine N-methyltransferase protein [Trichomonas vaginalis G3]EAY20595.1 SET domain containing protein [Trichomonas vaginalis G3]KAI5487220.1 histone-lysine N-methyltransferase protein [Trichomonas vaginalis G3]|eukprot:XP_001581581.1 SET domain containing protein [Trichomonas vaginalis G3]